MNTQCFEFWVADNGTWCWAGKTPAGTPIEQHGHRSLIDCVLAAADFGFTGDLDSYVVHRRLTPAMRQTSH